MAHGTTTASYFASLYEDASLVLADTAIQFGQRALVGKVNMITFAPSDYIETPEESFEKTKSFIKSMKEKEVRFFASIHIDRFPLITSILVYTVWQI